MHDPPRILVVDDMAENVDFLKTRLESQGYEVVTVTDGEAALAAMRESRPDFILLDIMMPKLDGIAALRHCRIILAAPARVREAQRHDGGRSDSALAACYRGAHDCGRLIIGLNEHGRPPFQKYCGETR